LEKQLIETENAMKPIRPYYSQGVKVTNAKSLLFVSGQTWDPSLGGSAVKDAAEQAEFIIKEIKAILEAGGATLEDIVRLNLFVRNIKDLDKIAPVRYRYFGNSLPASTLVEVRELWHPDVLLEIECTAAI
jgi:2-iminobutanoate/2-iminopropanoate deaminase